MCICCIRSSDGKRTTSRPLCEVKPHSAESVLARGTSMERSVMNTFFLNFFRFNIFFFWVFFFEEALSEAKFFITYKVQVSWGSIFYSGVKYSVKPSSQGCNVICRFIHANLHYQSDHEQ